MSELLDITRLRLVDHMVEIVVHDIGLDFDFVLMVRTGLNSSTERYKVVLGIPFPAPQGLEVHSKFGAEGRGPSPRP